MNFKPLLDWSRKEFRALPWRENRSLYGTLVSEIMLQQTTVGTVKNHYQRFLGKFPELKSLADASEEEVLVAWKGLGYYRRARSLKKIAESIVREYSGKFPKDKSLLQAISGIGPYTASAIIAIGMDKRAIAVDANLERVIARLYGLKSPKGIKLQKEIYALFEKDVILSHEYSYRDLNESLMDLGRVYCQARRVSCELCPLRKDCIAFKEGQPLSYPSAGEALKIKAQGHELNLLRIFVLKNDQLLVYKKESHEWLSGQYEVPTFVVSSTDSDFTQYPKMNFKKIHKLDYSYKTGITKYSIMNSLIVLNEKQMNKIKFPRQLEWRHISKETSNFTTATLKGLSKMEGKVYRIG